MVDAVYVVSCGSISVRSGSGGLGGIVLQLVAAVRGLESRSSSCCEKFDWVVAGDPWG